MLGLLVAALLTTASAQEASPFAIGGQVVPFGQARAEVQAALSELQSADASGLPAGIERLCTADGSLCAELFEEQLIAVKVRCAELGCPDSLDRWAEVQTHALRSMSKLSAGRAPYGPSTLWALDTLRAEFAEITIANSGIPPVHEASFADLGSLAAVVATHPGYLAALRQDADGPLGVKKRRDNDPTKPAIIGAIGIAEVDATILADREGTDACYAKALAKDPGAAGTTAVSFTLETDGTVSDIAGTPGSLDDKKIAKCLAKRVEALQFPPLRGGEQALVTYTFVVGP